MRSRRTIELIASRSALAPSLPAPAAEIAPPPFERVFRSDEIDLDDLTEAVRMLLAPDDVDRNNSPIYGQSALLSPAPRVSHVVEGTEAT